MPKPSMAASAGRSQAFWQASAPALCRPAAGRLPIPARPFGFIVGRPAVVQATRKMLSAICDLSLSGQGATVEAGDWRGDGFGPKIDERYLGLEVQCGYPVPRDVRAGDHVADRALLLIVHSMPTGTAVLRKLEHRMLSHRCGRPAHARQTFEHRIKSGCH